MAAGNPRSHPGRPLAFVALLLVVMGTVMVLTHNTTPRLGLDLRGGTSVTLTAKPVPGTSTEVTPGAMNQAVAIVRQRVDAFGVSESEVTTQGADNIIINIPGRNQAQTAQQVGQTALLYFRPVLVQTAPGPVKPTPNPTQTGQPQTGQPPTGQPAPGGATGEPSPAETSQRRAISEALGAAAPSPAPPPAPTPAPAPGQGPGQPANGQPAGEIPPDVQRDLVQLDCTKQENRQGSSLARPDEPVVACERDGIAKYLLGPAAVKGTDLSGASAQLPQQGASGGWFVSLTFDDQGTRAFAETTSQLSGQSPPRNQFAIVLDGLVVSAPQVNETIPGGQAQITGSFSQKESQDLASVLKYGALPLAFEKSEVNQISPTLSGDQLTGGLIAGALGLALVVVYSLLYYRGLGTVTVLSLIVAAAITYATAVLLGTAMGWTLTLAGIAGLIVAIGITADSFVVFFERLRDEVREGRSLRAAVEHGWVRARRTIIAADFVSFLAAAVLYILSVGTVRGFAFALGLTTLIDVLVVFLFTKPLVTLFAGTKFFGRGHPLSGLDPVRLGAKPGATSPFRHRAREI